MTTSIAERASRKNTENKLLIDLEDVLKGAYPDFELVGDNDIEKIAGILGQSEYNNVIYTGPSGVGKTANLLGIAQRKLKALDESERAGETGLPFHMVERRFVLLDVNTLFDSNDPAKIERDIRRIFDEMRKPGDYVLVIEDANDFLNGIRDHQCHGLISAFMRELKKGTFQTIWMVREEAGKKLEEVRDCHSEVTELFSILERTPADQAHVEEILKATRAGLEKHYHGLSITGEADEEIAALTFAYPTLKIYGREQPARALRLRDGIASAFVAREQARPAGLAALEKERDELAVRAAGLAEGERGQINAQIQAAESRVNAMRAEWNNRAKQLFFVFNKRREIETRLEGAEVSLAKLGGDLRDKLRQELGREPDEATLANRKTADIRECEDEIRALKRDLEEKVVPALRRISGEHNNRLTLGVGEVKEFFSEISGIPVADMDGNELEKTLNLDSRMKAKVLGQDPAVEAICGAVVRSKARKNRTRPIGSFVLLGSSGIGKSFIAECLAELLFDDAANLTVIDMSEYMEKHTVSRLIGAPPGYAGYGEGGRLCNAVREKPYQVLLLDEIDKAHPDVFKVLLQVMDKGRLTDDLGTVDFRNTIIIMTTNLGQELSLEDDLDPESEEAEESAKRALGAIFPQELINRVDGFPLLKALKPDVVETILRRKIDSGNREFAEDGISIALTDADIKAIVEDRYERKEGARQVQRFLERRLETQVDKLVLKMRSARQGGVIVAAYRAEQGGFSVEAALDGAPASGSRQTSAPAALGASSANVLAFKGAGGGGAATLAIPGAPATFRASTGAVFAAPAL